MVDEDREAKPIYEKKIDFQDVIDNPILKPIFEINETYRMMEQSIRFSATEMDSLLTELEKLMAGNPAYGKTLFVAKFKVYKDYTKSIIKNDLDEKKMMKKAINEMISIAKQYNTKEEPEKESEEQKEEEESEEPFPDLSSMNEPEAEIMEKEESPNEEGQTNRDNVQ